MMTKLLSIPSLFVFLICTAFAASVWAEENVYKGSESFEREGVTYRMAWTARGVTTGLSSKESTKVSYSVRIGDFFLHPKTLKGGTFIGCWDVPPAKVRWEPLGDPQMGWMLKLGGFCSGFTGSFKIHLVVPNKGDNPGFTDYVTAEFHSKETPIARWTADKKRLQVWSSYEQWSRMGNAYKFYVPELREFSVITSFRIIEVSCPPLPIDVRQWPSDLPFRSFFGDFYAGLDRLDARIMQSALDNYENLEPPGHEARRNKYWGVVHQEIHPEALRSHGLPNNRKGLQRLTNEIHEISKKITKARGPLGLLWLSWGNHRNKCLRDYGRSSRPS